MVEEKVQRERKPRLLWEIYTVTRNHAYPYAVTFPAVQLLWVLLTWRQVAAQGYGEFPVKLWRRFPAEA